MVELGIQTFHQPALTASKRGYTPETAHKACETVNQTGLKLAVQLLPGLPEHQPQHLASDIQATTQHNPIATRLYPCVVLQNTPLAATHEAGNYTPWTLEQTTNALADALLNLWQKNIPVIRIGLAPEQDLAKHIVAGPWHPALGQLARSKALLKHITTHKKPEHTKLTAPKRYQSDINGHQGSMRDNYKQIGLENLHFDDQDDFRLE